MSLNQSLISDFSESWFDNDLDKTHRILPLLIELIKGILEIVKGACYAIVLFPKLDCFQVGFLVGICLPCYELMAQVLPETQPMKDGAL